MPLLILAILSLATVDRISSAPERIIRIEPKKHKQVTVMIIDGEVNNGIGRFKRVEILEKAPYLKGENKFKSGHGSRVASTLIYGNLAEPEELCPEVKVISCRIFYNGDYERDEYLMCLASADVLGVDYVNISLQGGGFDITEYDALKLLTDKGVTVVVAAGNGRRDYTEIKSFPAAYDSDGTEYMISYKSLGPNLIAVQAIDPNGNISDYSNRGDNAVSEYGDVFTYNENGDVVMSSGTSLASPLFLHKMVRDEVCK